MSMQHFRAIATDIDGTLTYPDRKLHLKALEAVRMLEKKGVPVILVSGNNFCVVSTLADYIGTSAPVIAENGGVIGSTWRPKVLGKRNDVEKALGILIMQFEGRIEVLEDEFFRKTDIALRKVAIGDLEELKKLVIKESLNVVIFDSGYAVHIADKNINKGKGLKHVAKMMKINVKEIIAIADGANDLDLFKIAGYGIAVANAHPQLKKAANSITSKSYGEGFYEAIEYIFKNLEIKAKKALLTSKNSFYK